MGINIADDPALAGLLGESPATPAVEDTDVLGGLLATPQLAPEQPDVLDQLIYPDSTPEPQMKQLQRTLEQPELDTGAPDEEAGFFASLEGGAKRLYNSTVGLSAAGLANATADLAESLAPDTDFSRSIRQSAIEENLAFEDAFDDARDQPVSQTLQDLAAADSWGKVGEIVTESDEMWTVVKEVMGGSLPFSAGLIAGVATGGLPMAAAASYYMTLGDAYLEEKSSGEDEDEAWRIALTKAPVQAVFDVGAFKVADIALSKTKFLDYIGQTASQMLIGGGSEVAKGEAAGTDYTIGEVALEAGGEAVGAVPEVIVRRLTSQKKDKIADFMARVDAVLEEGSPELTTEERNARNARRKLEIIKGIMEKEGLEPLPEVDLEGLPKTDFDVTQEALERNHIVSLEEELQVAVQNAIQVEDREGNVSSIAEMGLQEGQVVMARDAQETTPHEEKALRAMRRTVENWVQALAPDMKIVVSTGAAGRSGDAVMPGKRTFGAGNSYGRQNAWGAGNELMIEIPAGHFVEANGEFKVGQFMEVMSHEFGHALIAHTMTNSSPEIQNSLMHGYRKWLQKMTAKDAEGKYPSFNRYHGLREGAFLAREFRETGQTRENLQVFNYVKGRGKEVQARDVIPSAYSQVVYNFGFAEYVADQMAKLAGQDRGLQEGAAPFFKNVMNVLKRFYRRFAEEYGTEESFQDYITYLGAKSAYDSARQKLTLEQTKRLDADAMDVAQSGISSIINDIKKEFGADAFPEDANGDLDTYGKALQLGGGLTHLAKENRHIAGLQHYIALTKEWWNTKMRWTSQADDTLKLWKKLGAKKGEAFGRFMLELTVLSHKKERGFKPGDKEFDALVEKWKLGDKELALYDIVKGDFDSVLIALEEVLMEHAERSFENDPRRLQDEVNSISEEMSNLRKLNFFPLSRFGSFFVKRVALKTHTVDGVEYKPGDTVSFEVYETKAAAKKAQAKGDVNSRALRGKLTDMQQQFAGMPPQFIRMLKDRLDLTVEQEKELGELLNDVAPGQSFKKHLAERKVVPGYNMDAMRGYASYFMHFSNHLGRIKFKFPFQDALSQVRDSANAVRTRAGDATKRDEILIHLQKHNDYILNPGNELANLRALGFLWYLGFVPKSAAVNLTQVPLVTYPYLAARYGDAEAVASIAKATRTASQYWRNPSKVRSDIFTMLQELQKRGIIDESLATELAATSEGSVAQRMVPGTFLKSESAARFIRNMAGAGAWMFQQAEKQNRRVTAIAAFELARKKGMSLKDAINAAEDAVETTQFEYARWNRPFFAQKKRSIFFLFWQYKTNALYFALRDPGKTRYMMMMLAMAGVAGLPFAEDLMDLVDWTSKKLAKQTGDADYAANTRQKIRELAAEVGANPDLILHGGSRHLFGLPALADMVGVPLANTDIGGSISMGRMVPGIEPLFGREGEVGQRLAKGAQELGGAILSVPINLIRAIGDDNPDTLRKFEKVLPSVARNFSKAYRFVRDEGDTLPNGAKIAAFDLEDSHHRSEIFMQAMGFTPTRSQEEKEKYYMVKENVQYWETQRRSLLSLWDYTRRTKDRAGLKEVKKAVHDFNRTVPFKGFAITGKDITTSIKNRIRDRKMTEAGIVAGKRGLPIQRDVEKGFQVPDVEEEEVP